MFELSIYFFIMPLLIAVISSLFCRDRKFLFSIIFCFFAFFAFYYLIEDSGVAILEINYRLGNPLNLDLIKYNPEYFFSEPLIYAYCVTPIFCFFIICQFTSESLYQKYITWFITAFTIIMFLFGSLIVYFYFFISILVISIKSNKPILQKAILTTIMALGLFGAFTIIEKIFRTYEKLDAFCIKKDDFFCSEIFTIGGVSVNVIILFLYLLWGSFLLFSLFFINNKFDKTSIQIS